MNAREQALKTLYKIFIDGAYSNLALKETLNANRGISAADKHLITVLVYGVVSRHYTLEYVIGRYSKIKPKKISDYIKLILEMGLYQLIYTDRIPQSAAVNESVKLAKKYGRRGSEKFVNGILRSFCRDGCKIIYPNERLKYLAVKYSYSFDMAKLFIDNFGSERAESVMNALNSPPPLMLRANSLKCSASELVEMLKKADINADTYEGALVKTEGFDIGVSDLYKKGYFTVQDAGAYNSAVVLAPKSGDTVLDMCAAPGGKSTHIAELMNNDGKIISCDIHEHKIKLINDSAKRLGIDCIKAQISDGTKYDNGLAEKFDKVLCDVPCSGLGIIRRKPDIKLGRSEISDLYEIQRSILENGSKYLKSGGTLVYSTCTLNKAENEGITDKFLEKEKTFVKLFEKTYLPDTDGSDGFYICAMKKN